MKTIQIRKNKTLEENIDILKKIYNIKTDTKFLEHLVNLEIKRQGI